MKPTVCATKQCPKGSGSLRCLAVAALVFAALAFASGAFAQAGQVTVAPTIEEGAGESDAGPSIGSDAEAAPDPMAEETLEADAAGPVDGAASSESPEELAGDVEPFDDTGDDDWGEFDDWEEEEGSGSGGKAFAFQIGGFVEGLTGARVVRSSASANEFTAAEARFRLNLDATHEIASARFRGDVYADGVDGRVWFDIRDASIFVRGGDWFNMRMGRHVLTWGTGDFLFLNDLFPKDFNSFFIGRADEYLKAPSNAALVTFNIKKVGLDLVWTPIFEPDRFIDGERLSFFNPIAGDIIGDRSPLTPVQPLFPDKRLRNGTVHGRLYGTAGAVELAAYSYVGYWLQPNAFDSVLMRPTYARLGAYGASVRAPLLGGLFNVEASFYDSMEDRAGTDGEIPNSQFRGLVGYERELFPKFQMGLQYYLEYTFEHDELIASSPLASVRATRIPPSCDAAPHAVSSSWTTSSSRSSPSSRRTSSTRTSGRASPTRSSSRLAIVVGANLMFGRHDYTFFGQLKENTNVYARLRYSF